jgi:hypothetical protein
MSAVSHEMVMYIKCPDIRLQQTMQMYTGAVDWLLEYAAPTCGLVDTLSGVGTLHCGWTVRGGFSLEERNLDFTLLAALP